ncbi:MAG: hypothetical protein F4144_04550 [Acidimicrobiaceae bacterium]|nr:hypothetical protein [Acidimicrobiaceae bacterium]
MATDFESDRDATAVERLSRPGAVQLDYHGWVPTLDGELIHGNHLSYGYPTREQALAEAIKRVKHQAGLAFEVKIGSRAGCCVNGDIAVIVETVAEARQVIVRHAKGHSGPSQREPDDREHQRFKTRRGRSAWKSLLACETSRHYDPADPGAGMTCSYLLYEKGPLGVVGGGAWTYSVEIWATGPPAIWDHPANQPAGLDNDDDLHNDYQPESTTNDPSELAGN